METVWIGFRVEAWVVGGWAVGVGVGERGWHGFMGWGDGCRGRTSEVTKGTDSACSALPSAGLERL